MNIQSITNGNNFRGLFTNKTAQNKGNWLVEYQPYSWETKDGYAFGAAPQTELDVFAKTLPDNEKTYTPAPERVINPDSYYSQTKETYGKEFCKDILGTEFYYKDFDSKTIRTDITQVDALNREDSLKIYARKLGLFEQVKKQKINELQESLQKQKEQYHAENTNYSKQSFNCDYYFLWGKKNYYKNQMDISHKNEEECVSGIINTYDKIISLNSTLQDTKNQKKECLKEAAILEKARKAGNLIDISSRTIYDPNRVLWEELEKGVEHVSSKLLSLPHKTVSMKEILNKLNATVSQKDFTKEVINLVDNIIRERL